MPTHRSRWGPHGEGRGSAPTAGGGSERAEGHLVLQGTDGPKGEKGESASDSLRESLVRGAAEDQGLPLIPGLGQLGLRALGQKGHLA